MRNILGVIMLSLLALGPCVHVVSQYQIEIDMEVNEEFMIEPSQAQPSPMQLIDVQSADGRFFVENLGQFGQDGGKYCAIGGEYSVAFDQGHVQFRIHETGKVFSVEFVDANPIDPIGNEPKVHRSNFLLGDDPNEWVTGARTYGKVQYNNLFEGIDLIYHFQEGRLKYEYVVEAGSAPSRIILSYSGVDDLKVEDATGDLLIDLGEYTLRDEAPVSYQKNVEGRTEVVTHYIIGANHTVAFSIHNYDMWKPLTIDPGLIFSTVFGEYNQDEGQDVVVDNDGFPYVTGYTDALKFDTTIGAFDTTFNGTTDAFIVKFSKNGSDLLYSTFIGGNGSERANGILVDDAGCIYVAGSTSSQDFPTTQGAYNRSIQGDWDSFVIKLNASGANLIYSTLLGGERHETCKGIDVDGSGCVFISGETNSSDFPATSNAFDQSYDGNYDIYITKFNESLSSIQYSTFIGGTGEDYCAGVEVDPNSKAYVAGHTYSNVFPTTPGAYDRVNHNHADAFVLKMSVDGTDLDYSTRIGGDSYDPCYSFCIDDQGAVYLTGEGHNGFPTTAGAYDRTCDGINDLYVTKLNPSASNLEYSTFIGGGSYEESYGICVDGYGRTYITGYTLSTNFPRTPDAYNKTRIGFYSVFLVRLNEDGSSIDYSTYFGGSGSEWGNGITTDNMGSVYFTGFTRSDDFPSTPGAFKHPRWGDSKQAFLARFGSFDDLAPIIGKDHTGSIAIAGEPFEFIVALKDDFGVSNASVEFWFGDGYRRQNLSMRNIDGNGRNGVWNLTDVVPHDMFHTLHYVVRATDATGNLLVQDVVNVSLRENVLPSIEDVSPQSTTTGDPYTFLVNVSDNAGIEEVRAVYWFGQRVSSAANTSMEGIALSGVGNGTYNLTIPVRQNSLEPLKYYLVVRDFFDNWNRSTTTVVNVTDNDLPTFEGDMSDDEATTGDAILFRMRVGDNIGIGEVRVLTWSGSGIGDTFNESMRPVDVTGIGNGTYVYDTYVVPSSSLEPISYVFLLLDTGGNVILTDVVILNVTDNDMPEVYSDTSDPEATTGDSYHFEVELGDNIGVSIAKLVYWFGSNSEVIVDLHPLETTGVGNGTYDYYVKVRSDSRDAMQYYIEIVDLEGNANSTDLRTVDIRDNDMPWFEADLTPATGFKGLNITLGVVANDNMGYPKVHVEYWFGEGLVVNESMHWDIEYWLEVPTARDEAEPLHYRFIALDTSGNWNSTANATLTLTNYPPRFLEIPKWIVIEEQEERFDLSEYIVDSNDPKANLTLTCDDAAITVQGISLRTRIDDWIPEFSIRVKISDGEDEALANITVAVTNVNDPPTSLRILSPANGTSFKQGETISFNLEFNDPDTVWGQLLTISWFSDQEGLLISYESFEGTVFNTSDLGRGKHFIHVEVDDSEITIESTIEVTVNPMDKDKFLPNLSGIFIILLLFIIGNIVKRIQSAF